MLPYIYCNIFFLSFLLISWYCSPCIPFNSLIIYVYVRNFYSPPQCVQRFWKGALRCQYFFHGSEASIKCSRCVLFSEDLIVFLSTPSVTLFYEYAWLCKLWRCDYAGFPIVLSCPACRHLASITLKVPRRGPSLGSWYQSLPWQGSPPLRAGADVFVYRVEINNIVSGNVNGVLNRSLVPVNKRV